MFAAVITLFYWPTANNHKVSIFLEETGLPYRVQPIDIWNNAQFSPAFLKVSPNNRVPAIVDDDPIGGGEPVSVFESGAILQYLAEKTGKLLPQEAKAKYQVLQWLYWQVGGLGPMAGQNHHFNEYAETSIPYAIDRYVKETSRLYGVLDRRLEGRRYLAKEYSIADIACYPWIALHERQKQDIKDYPNVMVWARLISERPAVQRAYRLVESIEAMIRAPVNPPGPIS
jgi:GST-like protein